MNEAHERLALVLSDLLLDHGDLAIRRLGDIRCC